GRPGGHRPRGTALWRRARTRFHRHPRGGARDLEALRLQAQGRRQGQRAHLQLALEPRRARRGAENEVTGTPRRALVALVVAISVVFAVAAHVTIVGGKTPGFGALLSLIPLALVAAWAVRRAKRPLAFAALALAVLIAWAGWGELERHFPDVFFLEHAG